MRNTLILFSPSVDQHLYIVQTSGGNAVSMVGKYSPSRLLTRYLTNEYGVPNFFARLYLNCLMISLNSHDLGTNCFTPMVPPSNPTFDSVIFTKQLTFHHAPHHPDNRLPFVATSLISYFFT
ncbi:hypothetical protein O181_061710 [Austropuccinia psidii MF-1]|uniref:Uncharacterized protein n=1 Tax=Austropuccinia psidii MF-1 TaxID=1389203 RepID=A0A9Q3I0Q8_9BASI|nr:hypothetical protein [Austropuccinia psidii MF-1]